MQCIVIRWWFQTYFMLIRDPNVESRSLQPLIKPIKLAVSRELLQGRVRCTAIIGYNVSWLVFSGLTWMAAYMPCFVHPEGYGQSYNKKRLGD